MNEQSRSRGHTAYPEFAARCDLTAMALWMLTHRLSRVKRVFRAAVPRPAQ